MLFPKEYHLLIWNQFLKDSVKLEIYKETLKVFQNFDSISNELIQGKVCILGCGRGYDAIMFAKKGFDVTAVDFAPTPIFELNKLAIQKSVTINTVQDDIFSLVGQYPDTFDIFYNREIRIVDNHNHFVYHRNHFIDGVYSF